jgi:hypothetical protein
VKLTTQLHLLPESRMRGAMPPLPLRLHGVVLSYCIFDGVRVCETCVLIQHYAMKGYWESGGMAPGILDFNTRWR